MADNATMGSVNGIEDKDKVDSEHFSPYRPDGKLVSTVFFN